MKRTETLRADERFVIDAVAEKFSATWRPGEDPPDAYLTIGDRLIAVEISTLTQQVTYDRGTRPRFSDDKVTVDLVRDLKLELSELVPYGQKIGLIFSSPILKPRKTKAALGKLLREKLDDVQSFATGAKIEINGNTITIFRSQHGEAKFDRISGIISHQHSNADLLCNARHILEDRIAEKAKKCAHVVGRHPLWLALLNDYSLADGHLYKYALSLFSSVHPFEEMLLINRDGTVESLFDSCIELN